MKILQTLSLVAIFFLFSCSNDDSSENSSNSTNYFPLAVGNNWNYDNTFSTSGQADFSGSEVLSVSNSTQISGNNAFEFESDNPQNSGITTNILTQGVLFKENSRLVYTGEFGVNLPEFSSLSFSLIDVTVYDTQVSSGTEMNQESETFQEQLENNIPITINVTVTSIMGETLQSLTVNNVTYEDVISSDLKIEIEAFVSIGPVTLPIVEEQDVTLVKNFFAKDIGLIKSESTTTIDFEVISQIPLEDINSSSEQVITSHSVNLD